MSKELDELNAKFHENEQESRERQTQAIELRKSAVRVLLSELLNVKRDHYSELWRQND